MNPAGIFVYPPFLLLCHSVDLIFSVYKLCTTVVSLLLSGNVQTNLNIFSAEIPVVELLMAFYNEILKSMAYELSYGVCVRGFYLHPHIQRLQNIV